MRAIADASGGLSVGIGAHPALEDQFHVLLPRGAWGMLDGFLGAYDTE